MTNDESFERLLKRASRAEGRGPGPCLDAETLAALSDGALAGRAREAAEAHAADCDRCLAVLASVTTAIPAQTEAAVERRWFSWQWLVPLATAAVVALVVVLQRPDDRAAFPAVPETAPVATAPVQQPAEQKPLADASRSASKDTTATQPQQRAASPRRTAAPVAEPSAANPSAERRQDAPAAGRAGPPPPAPSAPDLAAAAAETREVISPPPQLPARAPAPLVGSEAVDQLRRSERAAAFQASVDIASPDPAIRWRLSGNVVLHSTDAGQTWQQTTSTAVPIFTGAAPAPTVCWIVGASGLVLLTQDGRTWRTLPPPATAPLVAVRAVDASTAAVTTADGRTFRTTDAGRTWVLQEKPPVPF